MHDALQETVTKSKHEVWQMNSQAYRKPMRNSSTVIVGGGLAGLAAATALAGRGVSVTLLESRPRLGGRASSFVDRTTGERIDNCQHVNMGCCTNFQHFCRTIGLSHLLRRETQLYFISPDGVTNRFFAAWLPAPLHLWPAIRKLSYLSAVDLRQLTKGLRALVRVDPARPRSQSFAEWLQDHRQTPAAIERFWHVVLVSALSETLDRIGVAQARKVFVDAFLANRRGWEVQVPSVPLDDFYGTPLTDWLTSRGAMLRMQTGVKRIVLEGDTVESVELRNGERLPADHVIVTVPHYLALPLLPEQLRDHPQLSGILRLESAPISSVHLWFDRPMTTLPHAVFVDRLSHWMFNRTFLQSSQAESGGPSGVDESNPKNRFYYQVVISASRNLSDHSQQETIAEVVRELTGVWPDAAQAQLIHARLVTEHQAVFSANPGADAFRPEQQSPIANLQLAGDWTRTGWPATMEGAIRSGYLAAENVLGHLGRPEKLVQPDLPSSLLSKILLGL